MTSVNIFTWSPGFTKSRTLPINLAQGEQELLLNLSQTSQYQENELYKTLVFHFLGATDADVARVQMDVLIRADVSPSYSINTIQVISQNFVGLGALVDPITIELAAVEPSTISATVTVPLGPVSFWVSLGDSL